MNLKKQSALLVVLILSLILLGLLAKQDGQLSINHIRNNYRNENIKLEGIKVPQTQGNREGCLVCHSGVTGFSQAHDPQAIGCSSCHLGNPYTLNKDAAHTGLEKIPGNLKNAHLTCGKCHQDIADRIHHSLMATGRGMVAVNRYVFKESPHPDGPGHLSKLGYGPADSHLRRLCASCHINNPKDEYEPINQMSRGGGCTACHLHYSDKDKAGLKKYQKDKTMPSTHPALTVKVTNDFCFGCHSRSGRLSTNYEGRHETKLTEADVQGKAGYRVLDDERVFEKKIADVHHDKGLVCIDCHTSRETMGDGKEHIHQDEQTQVRCQDCHTHKSRFIPINKMDSESRKLIELHKIINPTRQFSLIQKSGLPMINVFPDKNGKIVMQGKLSGKIHPLKPPAKICSGQISGHERLSCQSCHTAWAPHCVACHTQFDSRENGYDHLLKKEVPGVWKEFNGPYLAEPPTLGVRHDWPDTNKGSARKNHKYKSTIIDTFIPGMILTINPNTPKSGNGVNEYTIFQRMYAPTSAHTIVKKGRSCESCHNDSLAIGFGRGKLEFNKKTGKVSFEQRYANHKADGLPMDAWTGWMMDWHKDSATRSDARPFNRVEQQKILTVGSCLICHPGNQQNIKRIYSDFPKAMQKKRKTCPMPRFD